MLKKILNKLNGLYYPQEYLCLDQSAYESGLRMLLFFGDRFVRDITGSHVFSGYSPLIFSFFTTPDENEWPEEIRILLSNSNEGGGQKDAMASLCLRRVGNQSRGSGLISHYAGTGGTHRFISAWHRFVGGLSNDLYNRKQGNVFLPNPLYRQVQIGYSIPRLISLVTVSDGKEFNLFPTDLHGPLGTEYYLDSLRRGGWACEQVMKTRRMVISEMASRAFRFAYALGKNHMQPMKPKGSFPFSDKTSPHWGLPLPESAVSCRELELLDHFDHGIHRILLFRVQGKQVCESADGRLAHVHNVYASWRRRRGLAGNYLLR